MLPPAPGGRFRRLFSSNPETHVGSLAWDSEMLTVLAPIGCLSVGLSSFDACFNSTSE